MIRAFAFSAMAILTAAAPMPVSAAAPVSPTFQGPLYDHPAVGSESWREPWEAVECNGQVSVYNTREPRIELFRPDPALANGAAVLMLPGGGLRVLGVGAESDSEVAAFLRQGVAVLRLEYRTAQTPSKGIPRTCRPRSPDDPPVRFPKMQIRNGNANPAPDDAELTKVLGFAIADAQEGFKLAHRMAPRWGLDPKRIGVIGTSAGGGVAFGTVFANTGADARPAFVISIFGPSLQDVVVPENAPPLFLVTEADHGPVTDGLMAVFSIWKDRGKSVELHIFDVPNFSMTADLWGGRLFDWMQAHGLTARVQGSPPPTAPQR